MLRVFRARRMKAALLTVSVMAGGTMFSSCGVVDVRHNVLAGTQAFVKAYTTSVWNALVPAPGPYLSFGAATD